MKLLEHAEPRYAPIEEVKARLVEAEADPGLLTWVIYAVGKYDTKWQAVLLLEQEDCLTVSIIGHDRSEMVWTESWSPVN